MTLGARPPTSLDEKPLNYRPFREFSCLRKLGKCIVGCPQGFTPIANKGHLANLARDPHIDPHTEILRSTHRFPAHFVELSGTTSNAVAEGSISYTRDFMARETDRSRLTKATQYGKP